MKILIKLLTVLIVAITLSCQINAAEVKNAQSSQATVAKAQAENYLILKSPTLIVDNPYSYLNKGVEFPAKFNKFSTLGLDYRPAMRESQVYIGVLIERDDVGTNVIPLSELKMFLKRSDAEKYTDLSAGDSIIVKGKVFSAALGDPWMDITEIKIISHKDKESK